MDKILRSYAQRSILVIFEAYEQTWLADDEEVMSTRYVEFLRSVLPKAITAIMMICRKSDRMPVDPPFCSTQVGRS